MSLKKWPFRRASFYPANLRNLKSFDWLEKSRSQVERPQLENIPRRKKYFNGSKRTFRGRGSKNILNIK